MKVSDKIAEIEESQAVLLGDMAKQMVASGKKVVSFALGEPDTDMPDYMVLATKDALDKGCTKYTTTQGLVGAREAIANWIKLNTGLEYDSSQIVISNGAKHSIYNALLSVIDNENEVIIAAPYWVSYPPMVRLAGGEPIIVDTSRTGFKLTAESLDKAITRRTKVVIINSPCNPTGVVYSEKELKELSNVIIENDLIVIADEIYSNFVYEGTKYVSVAGIPNMKDRTILIGGASKSFAMTGLRVGWMASNSDIAKASKIVQSHTTSCASSIAQHAVMVGLNDIVKSQKYIQGMVKEYGERRLLIMESLDKMSLDYVIPKGAFYVLVSVKQFIGKTAFGVEIESATVFAKALLENVGVMVVACEHFGINDYIRLSYVISKTDIVDGVKGIEKFLSNIE